MNSRFDFSVLMAVYHKDNPELLKKAILSAFDNSLPPLEMILVVDGPVDLNLKNTISNLKDKFEMRVLWLKKNTGLANALNKGLKLVKTKWVARADADDINLPNRFEIPSQSTHPDASYSNEINIMYLITIHFHSISISEFGKAPPINFSICSTMANVALGRASFLMFKLKLVCKFVSETNFVNTD